MYTQCTHCKAIFRVNMREVTVAKGKLRCGECQKVFTSTETLSTTIPQAFISEEKIEVIKESTQKYSTTTPNFKVKGIEEKQPKKSLIKKRKPTKKTKPSPQSTAKSGLILPILVGLLLILLVSQVLYHYRHIITGAPQHQPEKVQMLNHNVFTHPNEPNILLISATMENTANKLQPFPILEVRLTNSASKTVGLRRFTPSEYLEKYSPEQLFPIKKAVSLKLKIKDPGRNATGFQFNFF